MQNYIPDDGYTEKFYIAPVAGIHGHLRGELRPISRPQRNKHLKDIRGKDDEQVDRQSAELFATLIQSWSHQTAAGAPIPVTAPAILALKPLLYNRLFGLLMGDVAGDVDPQWTDTEKAAYAGTGLERAEADEKN